MQFFFPFIHTPVAYASGEIISQVAYSACSSSIGKENSAKIQPLKIWILPSFSINHPCRSSGMDNLPSNLSALLLSQCCPDYY